VCDVYVLVTQVIVKCVALIVVRFIGCENVESLLATQLE